MKTALPNFLSRIFGLFVALLVGFLAVVVIEIIFGQVDQFAPPPLLKKVGDSDNRVLKTVNPHYALRFFSGVNIDGMRMAPYPYIEPSDSKKLRVVVAGGSTIQGYPHPRRLTASAYTRSMLADIFPEYQVDVFNLGITAVSSFVVKKVVQEALSLNPQIVIVYTGHNEIYGVYGSASLSPGGNSLLAKSIYYDLMQLSTTGFLRFLIDKFVGMPTDSRVLLNVMSDAGMLDSEDLRRKEAVENLKGNIRELAAQCKQKGVVLIVCTVASNERGFAPGFSEPKIGEKKLSFWRNDINLGLKNLYANPNLAASHFESALDIAGEHPWTLFHYARSLEVMGETSRAHLNFVRAKDKDLYPWRASSEINIALQDVSGDFGLILVDIEKVFRQNSPASGIGWELMDDHLHPSTAGQLLLARSWSQSIKLALGDSILNTKSRSDTDYLTSHGNLPLETMAVYTEMHSLLSEPPMDKGNEDHAKSLEQKADSVWLNLTEGERRGFQFWKSGNSGRSLVLSAADQLFANGEWDLARKYYLASQLEEPYTPWGDVWANLRAARCIQLNEERNLNAIERLPIESIPAKLDLISSSDILSNGIKMFFIGYCKYLLGQSGVQELEIAAKSEDVKRLFFYDLLKIFCEELPRLGRISDAEKYVKEITSFVDQRSYGVQLLEGLALSRKTVNQF